MMAPTLNVIASEAKQSRAPCTELDGFVAALLAMTGRGQDSNPRRLSCL
uniref:Uncharacterized protein n=1 Tax=Rhodopseudomonas palustris (strain DX-1) TaxID=652103 RepID=E6VHG1_RHOPX